MNEVLNERLHLDETTPTVQESLGLIIKVAEVLVLMLVADEGESAVLDLLEHILEGAAMSFPLLTDESDVSGFL